MSNRPQVSELWKAGEYFNKAKHSWGDYNHPFGMPTPPPSRNKMTDFELDCVKLEQWALEVFNRNTEINGDYSESDNPHLIGLVDILVMLSVRGSIDLPELINELGCWGTAEVKQESDQ